MSEVTCRNCQAACCKGPELIEFTASEADFILRGGTNLVEAVAPADHEQPDAPLPVGYSEKTAKFSYLDGHETRPLQAGFGRYFLLGVCGYLEVADDGWEHCGAYDDPKKPMICDVFEEGGLSCLQMRVGAGIEAPDVGSTDLRDMLESL